MMELYEIVGAFIFITALHLINAKRINSIKDALKMEKENKTAQIIVKNELKDIKAIDKMMKTEWKKVEK